MKNFLKIKFLHLIFLIFLTFTILSFYIAWYRFLPNKANAQNTLSVTEFSLPDGNPPNSIALGPDNNLWVTEIYRNKIARISPTGEITEFLIPTINSEYMGIVLGSDGNLWFTENIGKIGKITPNGIITEFLVPSMSNGVSSQPYFITSGSDGNLWFTEYTSNKIGKITPEGIITEYTIPTLASGPWGITNGPDGNIWFTEYWANKIGRITLEGSLTEFTIFHSSSYPMPYPDTSLPFGITSGPDGNIWFTESNGGKIGRITTDGQITEFQTSSDTTIFNITTGPDGNLWLAGGYAYMIAKIDTNGFITEYPVPPDLYKPFPGIPYDIVTGPDGNIWYTDINRNKISRINLVSAPTPTPPPGILNVPLLKQGIAPFNDSNPVWERNEYDHGNSQSLWCGTTIADCGCAATSIAMLLRYYNIVNPFDGAVTTPSTVNEYFKQNTQCGTDGCVSLGYAFGDIRWTAVNNYSAEAHQNYNTQKIIYDGAGEYNPSVVTQDINDSKPVILGVPNHWIIATGISGNTFAINDPLFNRTFLNDPAYNNTAVQGMRRYKKTNSDFSSIEVAVLAPAQVIITDPQGNKTGFDPNSFTVINNIPNSNYFFDQAFTNQNQSAPPLNAGVYWAIVQTPESGQYEIEIVNPQNSPYSFAVYGSDQNASVNFKLFEGQPSTFLPTRYLFDYSSTPGETTISQQVLLDVKPEGNSDVINPKSNGVIRVAVLSSDTFNATTIDSSSVTLGSNNAPPGKNVQTKDVNRDKKPDRVFYFYTNQTGIVNGDTAVCLSGKTTDGYNIKGCDTIRTVPMKH